MKLHEYQAKDIFRKWGISVPRGQVIDSPQEAVSVARDIEAPLWVVKAQVHAGGRGKGGGVKVVHDPTQAASVAQELLSSPLITPQTGPDGVQVKKVLIEEGLEIKQELYLGSLIDRSSARPVMIFSPAGGMDIEEVAACSPELILKETIDPAVGWMPYQARNLIYGLSPSPPAEAVKSLGSLMAQVSTLFTTLDCSLVEINPLVITETGGVFAADAKISIDDNALYRQKDLAELEDTSEKDPLELAAQESGINYIRLDGNIGAMVNGAGLAMATMDVIKMAGAEPANFLDVGGGASEEMITKGFQIILRDKRVKAILINIFGGILRCDVLARGVLEAAKNTKLQVPLIIRLEGTNVDEGRSILQSSDLRFLVAKDLAEAAKLVANQVAGAS